MSQNRFTEPIHNDILSPPTTPKRNMKEYFQSTAQSGKMIDDIKSVYHDFMELASSQSPPYSPPLPMSSEPKVQSSPLQQYYTEKQCTSSVYIVQPLSFATWMSDLHCSTPTHRRKQKPSSPIRSATKGSFTLPLTPMLRRQKSATSLCNDDKTLVSFPDQTRKRKYKFMNCATKKKLLCLAKADNKPVETRNCRSPFMSGNGSVSLSNESHNKSQTIGHNRQDNTHAPFKNTNPIDNVSKAMKDDAQFFDNVTADSDIATLFKGKEDWIPKADVFQNRAGIRIAWKGSPLKIQAMPYFDKLHSGEVPIAATLRLTPEQYLRCKYALILAAHKATEDNTMFRKSEAQKACCIDVNKASVLWKVFGKLGWLGSKWPN